MPSFDGRKRIVLQPNDAAVPYRFEFPIASANDANDGAVPYGDTVSSVAVTAHDADGTDVSGQIVGAIVNGTDYCTVALTYPATAGAGDYKLSFVVTTANGADLEFDLDRVVAVDL